MHHSKMASTALVLLLASTTPIFASPLSRRSDHSVVTKQGEYDIDGVPFDADTLEEFFADQNGRRRSLNSNSIDYDAVAEWIIPTKDAATRKEACKDIKKGSDSSVECINELSHVFEGLIVKSTLTKLLAVFKKYSNKLNKISPALTAQISEVQTQATWGIDRIDGDLDQEFNHNPNAGAGVKVFVGDTGVRCTHNEFGNRCVPGWSAYDGGACSPTDMSCATDRNGHGTHCAGTIGGTTYGVSKSVTIVAVKMLSDSGSGSYAGIISGIEWVMEQKLAEPNTPMVLSMSLGGGRSTALNTAITSAYSAGVVVSVAAGNDNRNACLSSPASAPEAITVGSTTSSDARSGFSNYGTCLDIWAPGSAITSAWDSSDSATNTISGTSMACPHVSGVLAQILSDYPSYTPDQAEASLLISASSNEISGIPSSPESTTKFLSNQISPASPTPSTTRAPTMPSPTSAPTVTAYVDQGSISSGQTKQGNTRNPGLNTLGGASPDHTHTLTVTERKQYTITTCSTPRASYDTFLRLYLNNSQVTANDDDSSCSSYSRASTMLIILNPGTYVILVEGWSSEAGEYALTVTSADAPTATTRAPPSTTVEANETTSSPSNTTTTLESTTQTTSPTVTTPATTLTTTLTSTATMSVTTTTLESTTSSNPTPAPTPSPSTSNPTPSPTPSPSTSNPTPSPTSSNPTPSPSTSNPTPSPTPSPSTSAPTPAPFSSNPTPSPTPPPSTPSTPSTPLTTSTSTSTSGFRFAAKGSGNANNNNGAYAEEDNRFIVRCCSDTPIQGWKQKCNSIYTESDAWDAGCQADKTFSEAEEFCASVGGRLCTKTEVLGGCVKGTGCNFNSQMMWTSSVETAPTTTSAPVGVCKSWCPNNSRPWSKKCTWKKSCAGCNQCN